MATEQQQAPKIDLSQPRYDQTTWLGRFKHFASITSPTTLLTTQAELDSALKLLKDYEQGTVDPSVTTDQLWHAKRLKDSIIHSDTNEPIFAPFRLSAFTPMNIAICMGLLIPNPSIPTLIFWQWINQSYNVAINHANRNASNEMSNEQVGKAYLAACGSSCAIAVGLSEVVKRASKLPPGVAKFVSACVPFVAVATAGIVNVFLMRRNELTEGVAITDKPGGTVVGKSAIAGQLAVSQVAACRVFTSMTILIIPPVVMHFAEKTSLLMKHPGLHTPFKLMLLTGILLIGLPASVALFPQYVAIEPSKLEPKYRELQRPDGTKLDYVYFNKGL